jgi:oligosaccharide 4-alpha-D-glucosyltransferase
MQKLSFLFLFLLSFTFLTAQITLSPEKPGFTEVVTLTYDAAQGNGALEGHKGDIYVHTGLITNQSAHAGDWKNVVADWNDNKPQLKLKRTGDNTYQLQFKITELYGVPPDGGIAALAFVFRNEDGSKVGKTTEGNDLYFFFKELTFKKPAEAFEVSQAKEPEWAQHATIYEVNVRQFTEEGTFEAFSKHLPRLRAMGVDILWFMPIQPIGEKKRKGPLGSYYSVKNYKGINPEFGTIEDFQKLVDKCHGMGFKVILDWVANHSAWDNEWTDRHPDWYVRDDNGEILAPFDWTDVAKLNYDMYYMREAMTDAMMYWVEDINIDGFRCDVAGEVPLDFWEDVRRDLDDVKPIWMIAENADQMWLMNKAFNANYGWPFHHQMNMIAKGKEKANTLFEGFASMEENYPKGAYPMQFITNHDENSWNGTIEERLGEGHKAFATLSFTMPGIPLIYSGQEAGMKKRLKFFERDPIDWSDKSLIPFYTKLNDLKAENPALWNGNAGGQIKELPNDKEAYVVAFSREQGNNKVVTIINLSGEEQLTTVQAGEDNGIYLDYFTDKKINLTKRAKVKLAPWEYKVLVFKDDAPEHDRTFHSVEKTRAGLRIVTSDGTINITSYTESTMEVVFTPVGEKNPPSYAVDRAPAKVRSTMEENDKTIEYETNGLSVTITKSPFSISYAYKNQPLFSEEKGYFDDGVNKGFRFTLEKEEQLTGGGSRVLGMNRRGHRLQLYNKASYGYETEAELMYYSLPIVISSKKYMIVFDNGANGWVDLGATEEDILQFEAVGGRTSYLIAAADKWNKLATHYTSLTGRQPMVPRWAMGNIASRMGYHSQEQLEGVVDQYLKDDIPLDAIVLDLYWFGKELQGTLGRFEWHTDSFPEPEKMMAGIKEKGVKTILITEPFIIKNQGYYDEVIEKGLVGVDENGAPYHYDFYFGNTLLLDIFKKETRQWFWDIYKRHTLTGVDGWWGDLGEPEVHPEDLLHVNGRADDVHNLYGHEWAKTIFDGFEKDFPNRRPVILMRSGFAGSQRYGMLPWTGDVNRSWGGFKPQVELGITMGMQGLGYTHSDLGGFAGDYEDAELYNRWLQYGVFQPIYRTHAQEQVPAEPIYWDEATKANARRYIKLRYALMPYNYTLTYENAMSGVPMMRPLFYVDDTPGLFDEKDLYLWGDNFLVSPVTEKGATKQRIYFPKGASWIDYWTGKTYTGGQEIQYDIDPENTPVFVKAGSFIPMTPVFQSMKDYTSEKLAVHYYHDHSVTKSDGFMYEDDGETKEAYFKKMYETINFESIFRGGVLNLSAIPEGYDYKGKPASRELSFVIHNLKSRPKSVTMGGRAYLIKDAGRGADADAIWDGKSGTLTIVGTLKGEMNWSVEL